MRLVPAGKDPAANFVNKGTPAGYLPAADARVGHEDLILQTRNLGKDFRGFTAVSGVDLQVVYDEWASQTALKYLVPPEDITGTVVYLASDLARPVTGQAIYTGAGQWFH